MRIHHLLAIIVSSAGLAFQGPQPPPTVLPAAATTQLAASLKAAAPHAKHTWRDTPPRADKDTVNAYIEIARGDRQKWEFDMGANKRAIDRVIPESVGGYPVNYGFVPQTVSYDGDPFDALVLGPAIPGGTIVRGVIVGFMYMEDEKGLDSKVVLSPLDPAGRPRYQLTAEDRDRIGGYFKKYKLHEPGKFSKVPGWGSIEEGRAYVETTHVFFHECRTRAGAACQITR